MEMEMQKNKGFKLIELMISLSIVGVLLGYGTPSFYKFKQKMTMESERNRLFTSLHFARSYAISNNTHILVCPSLSGLDCDTDSDWYKGWIVFVDSNGNKSHEENEKLLIHENSMMNNIEAKSSIYRQKIRFNSMGFSPGTNLSINFCDSRGSDLALSIIINNAGRIKQSKPISNNVCNS
jgi:type IV fimbrial biogenesis protein FimT